MFLFKLIDKINILQTFWEWSYSKTKPQ